MSPLVSSAEHPRHDPQGAEIELELAEVGPNADVADQDEFADAVFGEERLHAADLAPFEEFMRIGGDARVGLAVDRRR